MRRLALVLAAVLALPATAAALPVEGFTEVYKAPRADGFTTCHEARYWSDQAIAEQGESHPSYAPDHWHKAVACKRLAKDRLRKGLVGRTVTWRDVGDHRDFCNVWTVPRNERVYVMCDTDRVPVFP